MSEELNPNQNIPIVHRTFKVDYDKMKTLEDVVMLLKSMNMSVYWFSDDCPDQFKELYDKGFLIEEKTK